MFIIHASGSRGVSRLYSCVCLCPCCKRKTAWAINTKLRSHTVHRRRSACIDRGVKRSKVKGQSPCRVIKCAASVGLQVDTTAGFLVPHCTLIVMSCILFLVSVFTMRSHVVCPSVCPSVCDVGELWPHWL